MIKFDNVTVCYNPHDKHPDNAVDRVHLRINKGEWVFFVGPSGAGKSTLLRLLHGSALRNGQDIHISGKVLLEEQDITFLPARKIPYLRRKIGVVFQDFQLLPQKSAWENVAFALRVTGASHGQIAREVPKALDTVGLGARSKALPHQLSGGEQQRVAIARAIVNQPHLLLADEPTGNLDPQTGADIAQVLKRINEELQTTVVMATHDRHLVDSARQRVVRLQKGQIISDQAQGIYHPEDDLPPPQPQTLPDESTFGDVAIDNQTDLVANPHAPHKTP